MKKTNGFSLFECILVIVLIAIISMSVSPLLNHHRLFQERFFVDELISLLRFAHQTSIASGCEIQVGYKTHRQLSLFMRQGCTMGEFSHLIQFSPQSLSEPWVVEIPQSIVINGSLPLYLESDGSVYNQTHQWQKTIILQVKAQQILVDGLSGFVYEKDTARDLIN